MFDLFDAWREIAHIAEFTGLSVGLLAGLAALAWFDPLIRGLAVRLAIVVAIGYTALMFGIHLGSTDKQAQWDQADKEAAAARVTRDKAVDMALDAKYQPQILALTKQSADLQRQVDAYENNALAHKLGDASCQLGAAALRLRR